MAIRLVNHDFPLVIPCWLVLMTFLSRDPLPRDGHSIAFPGFEVGLTSWLFPVCSLFFLKTGVTFAFSQFSGISPDCHGLWKTIEMARISGSSSVLVSASHQSPWTCGCQIWLNLTLTQSSFIKEKSFFLQMFSLLSWVKDSWGLDLEVKAAKKDTDLSLLCNPLQGSSFHPVTAPHFPSYSFC